MAKWPRAGLSSLRALKWQHFGSIRNQQNLTYRLPLSLAGHVGNVNLLWTSNKAYRFLCCACSWITSNSSSGALKIESLQSYSSKILLVVSLETWIWGQVWRVKWELESWRLQPSLQIAVNLGVATMGFSFKRFTTNNSYAYLDLPSQRGRTISFWV